jgi:hypothetical protein
MVLVVIATIILLAKSCVDKLSPNGGHLFDENDEWRIALPANASAIFAKLPSD